MKALYPGLAVMLALLLTCVSISPASASDAKAAVPAGYSFVKDHVISGSPDGSLTDYSVMFVVHRGSGIDSGRDVYLGGGSQSWPNDLRFTGSGENPLSYWLESTTDDTAIVWVKVPEIPQAPGTTTVRLLYGKAGDPGASDGPNTFLIFDDFGSGASGKWTTGGSPAFDGSSAHLGPAGAYLESESTFDPGSTALRAKVYTGLPSDYFTCLGYGEYQPGGGWGYLDESGAYLWFEYGAARNIRWFIHHNITLTGPALTDGDTWHNYDIYTDTSRKSVFINRDDLPFLSGSSPYAVSSAKHILFGRHDLARGSADVEADWILVRKHARAEPAHGAWSAANGIIPASTRASSGWAPGSLLQWLNQHGLLILGAIAAIVVLAGLILALIILVVVVDQRIHK